MVLVVMHLVDSEARVTHHSGDRVIGHAFGFENRDKGACEAKFGTGFCKQLSGGFEPEFQYLHYFGRLY